MDRQSKAWIEWTTTEVRILTEAWESGMPLRTRMHLLPRHTLRAALVKGRLMGLPSRVNVVREKSANAIAMRIALREAPTDAQALADRTGMSRRSAQSFLKDAHEEGLAHITGWRKSHRNGPPFAIFAWGEGDDVPHPKPADLKNRLRRPAESMANNPFRRMVLDARQLSKEAA